MTDASVDGLGAVVEQEQKYGTVRPICVLSRSTPPNERNWSATELECAAIVWAVKKNRRMFCGIPYIVVSGNQPLKTFESLATKVDRVHRWSDFLSAYNYKLVCRPGRLKCNADLLCRLPPPGTNEETNTDLRLTDQTDIDVYFDGASGVQPRMRTRTRSILGGLEQPDYTVAVGGVEHSTAPRTTDEQAKLPWQVMQCDRDRETKQKTPTDNKRVYAIRDDSPFSLPEERAVLSGQLEPGLMLHALSLIHI